MKIKLFLADLLVALCNAVATCVVYLLLFRLNPLDGKEAGLLLLCLVLLCVMVQCGLSIIAQLIINNRHKGLSLTKIGVYALIYSLDVVVLVVYGWLQSQYAYNGLLLAYAAAALLLLKVLIAAMYLSMIKKITHTEPRLCARCRVWLRRWHRRLILAGRSDPQYPDK